VRPAGCVEWVLRASPFGFHSGFGYFVIRHYGEHVHLW
jgi:hypothetical protein